MELLGDDTVLKSPFPDAEMENHILDIGKEASIYHRLGPHDRLVRILGHSRDGLILEYMKNGDLKTYLRTQSSVSTSQKLNWAYQIAQPALLEYLFYIRMAYFTATSNREISSWTRISISRLLTSLVLP